MGVPSQPGQIVLQDPISKKKKRKKERKKRNHHKNRAGGMAEGENPEFKPQYCMNYSHTQQHERIPNAFRHMKEDSKDSIQKYPFL
jgi:hypothetical protein